MNETIVIPIPTIECIDAVNPTELAYIVNEMTAALHRMEPENVYDERIKQAFLTLLELIMEDIARGKIDRAKDDLRNIVQITIEAYPTRVVFEDSKLGEA